MKPSENCLHLAHFIFLHKQPKHLKITNASFILAQLLCYKEARKSIIGTTIKPKGCRRKGSNGIHIKRQCKNNIERNCTSG